MIGKVLSIGLIVGVLAVLLAVSLVLVIVDAVKGGTSRGHHR